MKSPLLLSTWFFFIRIKMTIQLCLYMKFWWNLSLIIGSFAVVTRLTWLMPEYIYTPNAILYFTYSTTRNNKKLRDYSNSSDSLMQPQLKHRVHKRKHTQVHYNKKKIVEITKWHFVRERILHTLKKDFYYTHNSCTLLWLRWYRNDVSCYIGITLNSCRH